MRPDLDTEPDWHNAQSFGTFLDSKHNRWFCLGATLGEVRWRVPELGRTWDSYTGAKISWTLSSSSTVPFPTNYSSSFRFHFNAFDQRTCSHHLDCLLRIERLSGVPSQLREAPSALCLHVSSRWGFAFGQRFISTSQSMGRRNSNIGERFCALLLDFSRPNL